MSLKMKKSLGIKSVMIWVLPVVFLMTSSAVLRAEEMGPSQARIVKSEGDITIKSASSSEWVNGTKGMMLDQGTEVMAGEDSSALVTLGEGRMSTVKIDSGTEIILSSLDPVKLNLKSGKLIALVSKLKEGSTFQVMTPTATATVRGTQLLVTEGFIAVLEGSIDVEINGQMIHVNAGEQVNTSSGEVSAISADYANDIENASEEANTESTGSTTEQQQGEGRQNIQVPATP